MKLRFAPSKLVCSACVKLALGARCPARCPRNFVASSWSSSLNHSRDAGILVATDYAEVMREQIAKYCIRPECRVLVAYDDDLGPEEYVGFIAGEPIERVVYYVFVKELSRQHGIAKALFAELGIDPASRFAYPASTRILEKGPRLARKIPLAIRDPAVARYPKDQRHRSYG